MLSVPSLTKANSTHATKLSFHVINIQDPQIFSCCEENHPEANDSEPEFASVSFPSSRCQNKITTELRKGERAGLIYFNVLKPKWFLVVLLGWEPAMIISLVAEYEELPVHAPAPSLCRKSHHTS